MPATLPSHLMPNTSPALLHSHTGKVAVNTDTHIANNSPHHRAATNDTLEQGQQSSHPVSYQERKSAPAYTIALSQNSHSSLTTYTHLSHSTTNNQQHSSSETHINKTTTVTHITPANESLSGSQKILSFIEGHINNAKANGASDSELYEALQQGLAGFEQGFSEAQALLSDSGLITEEVSTILQTMHQDVINGIDQLRTSLLDEPEAFAALSGEIPPFTITSNENNSAETISTPASTYQSQQTTLSNSDHSLLHSQRLSDIISTPKDSATSALIASLEDLQHSIFQRQSDSLNEADINNDVSNNYSAASTRYAQQSTFSFELTTSDGDTVSIKANQDSSSHLHYRTDSGDSHQLSESSSANSHFSFSVTGELDAEETAAIEHLLTQVMSLADEFYQGDVGAAYDEALNIGYDSQEITAYAFSLKQTETYQAAAVYQGIAPESAAPSLDPTLLKPIANYAQKVLETLSNHSHSGYIDYPQLLDNISAQIDNAIEAPTQRGMNDAIHTITQPQ